jgi:predicted dehydrogenase
MNLEEKGTKNMVEAIEKIPKIGLVGCGAIAENYYLPALANNPSVAKNLILVDRDQRRTDKLAAVLNIKNSTGDFHEILYEVDGVILALPIELHYSVSMEFLAKGIPVLCEKPLAESGDKAREMVDTARKAGAALCVNYFQRLIPSFAKVKQLISDGILGKLQNIEYFVGEKFDWPTVTGFYFNSSPSSRGVLRDRGAHVIDHICWWLGAKPELLSSFNDSFGGSDALAQVQFKHKSCFGEVRLSWLSQFPCRYFVKGDEASVEGEVYDYQNLVLATDAGSKKHIKLEAADKLSIASKIISNFLAVIGNNEKPLVQGSDVLNSVQFIDECYQKASRFPMPWYDVLVG